MDRREFVKIMGIAGAAATITPSVLFSEVERGYEMRHPNGEQGFGFVCINHFIVVYPILCIALNLDHVLIRGIRSTAPPPPAQVKKQKKSSITNKRDYISPKLRYEVLTRDNYTCQCCGQKSPDVEIEVDHIKPVAKGGGSEKENLRALCWECNIGKSDS